MYLHKTKNGHYTPPCCYFSGELEVVECIRPDETGRYLDLAKAVGMLCVLIGHSFISEKINTVIYAFHMPLFFFISGYLCKPQKVALKKINQKCGHIANNIRSCLIIVFNSFTASVGNLAAVENRERVHETFRTLSFAGFILTGGCSVCTVGGFDHDKVFSTNGKRPDCLFGIVVIHWDMAIR